MKFYVFQSLRSKEEEIGNTIYQYLISKSQQAAFFKFHTRAQLFEQLKLVAIDASMHKSQTFVHLTCHGNDDGIGVIGTDASETLITWDELRESLREIYISSGLRVILCMSSCEGFNAVKLVPRFQPCPYDHVTGSFESISFKDAVEGYKLFYSQVITGISVYEASIHVNKAPGLEKMKFIGLSSQSLLELAINSFLEKECSASRMAERKEETRKQLLTMMSALSPSQELSQLQEQELDHIFSMEGQQPYVEKLRDAFYS